MYEIWDTFAKLGSCWEAVILVWKYEVKLMPKTAMKQYILLITVNNYNLHECVG